MQNPKYAVMYIPRSGLFFTGGGFFNGRQEPIPWKNKIYLFPSRDSAMAVRDKLKVKWKNLEGDFIVVTVEMKEEAGGHESGMDMLGSSSS